MKIVIAVSPILIYYHVLLMVFSMSLVLMSNINTAAKIITILAALLYGLWSIWHNVLMHNHRAIRVLTCLTANTWLLSLVSGRVISAQLVNAYYLGGMVWVLKFVDKSTKQLLPCLVTKDMLHQEQWRKMSMLLTITLSLSRCYE